MKIRTITVKPGEDVALADNEVITGREWNARDGGFDLLIETFDAPPSDPGEPFADPREAIEEVLRGLSGGDEDDAPELPSRDDQARYAFAVAAGLAAYGKAILVDDPNRFTVEIGIDPDWLGGLVDEPQHLTGFEVGARVQVIEYGYGQNTSNGAVRAATDRGYGSVVSSYDTGTRLLVDIRMDDSDTAATAITASAHRPGETERTGLVAIARPDIGEAPAPAPEEVTYPMEIEIAPEFDRLGRRRFAAYLTLPPEASGHVVGFVVDTDGEAIIEHAGPGDSLLYAPRTLASLRRNPAVDPGVVYDATGFVSESTTTLKIAVITRH